MYVKIINPDTLDLLQISKEHFDAHIRNKRLYVQKTFTHMYTVQDESGAVFTVNRDQVRAISFKYSEHVQHLNHQSK